MSGLVVDGGTGSCGAAVEPATIGACKVTGLSLSVAPPPCFPERQPMSTRLAATSRLAPRSVLSVPLDRCEAADRVGRR